VKATGEIQLIPIGVGVSLRRYVRRAHELLASTGLTVELHAQGTNVEGELGDILRAVELLHEQLHAEGVPRISTALKLGTRIDKPSSLAAKVAAVRGDDA
jgi:uncharacterized protein (TIGR00106 family)